MAAAPVEKATSIGKFNEGVVEEDEEEDDTSATSEAGDDTSQV